MSIDNFFVGGGGELNLTIFLHLYPHARMPLVLFK